MTYCLNNGFENTALNALIKTKVDCVEVMKTLLSKYVECGGSSVGKKFDSIVESGLTSLTNLVKSKEKEVAQKPSEDLNETIAKCLVPFFFFF